MIPQIPREMLRHSVTFESLTGADADGNGTFATAAAMSFVWCEPVKDWLRNNMGEMKDDKLTLFYDCVNSDPAGTAFKKGDRVTFSGSVYIVRTVKDFSPHHLEVVLI